MNPLYHDRMFFDARKRLAVATRLDAMHCLSAVRRLVAELLTSLCAEPALVRVVRSDIVETLLAREALRIAAMEPYQTISRAADREQLLEFALTGYLLDWLQERTEDPTQRALIEQGTRQFAAHLTSARPS
jgi:hypothetical protein